MKELIKIDPKEFGLEESKASEIESAFKPMLEKMTELENEYNEVIKLDVSKETCDKAKSLRLKYVKIRTGTASIHKDMKAFYLAGGRFVDGWKNAQLFASNGIEDKLMSIEKHYENIEIERISKLQEKRASELSKYVNENDMLPENLGEMSDEIWNNYLTGTKTNYETKIAAEKKVEQERAEGEKRQKIFDARMLEIAKYGDHATKQPTINTTLEEWVEMLGIANKNKVAYIEEQVNIRKENERLKKERELAEKIRLETQKKAEESLRKEREAKEKIENELKLKKEAEELAKKKRLEDIEIELSKGDAAKVKDLIADLELIKEKYQFKSAKNKAMFAGVQELIDKTVSFIKR